MKTHSFLVHLGPSLIFWLSSTSSGEGPWVGVRLDPWLKEPPLAVVNSVRLMLDWAQ